jgi:hypothetical protein
MELTLNAEEHQLLLSLIEQRYRGIQIEISHTDHHEFKALLRRHQELLDSMLSRLQVASLQKAS